MNIIYVDTEYSSFYSPDKSKSGDLLQLAAVPVIGGQVMPHFNEYCRPIGRIWSPEAQKVHKIEKEWALRQQHPEELSRKFVDYLQSFDCMFTMAGFNCRGDMLYIERQMHDYDHILKYHKMARLEWRDVRARATARKRFLPIKSLTLESLSKFYGLTHNAHNALSDADNTRKIDDLLSLVNTLPQSIQMEVSQLTNLEKRQKYLDRKYFQIGHGTAYISEHATMNPEAMKVIIEELWDLYVVSR